VLPVAVSGKRWVATRGGGDTLSSIDDMERRGAPASVCLAVLLATAGYDHPLAAREEIARLRARVRVEAEDVERAGVTAEKVNAWLDAQTKVVEGVSIHPWVRVKTIEHGIHAGAHWTHFMFDGVLDVWNNASSVANAIDRIARFMRRPGLDILDEMAALEVQP
jgi:hypothetical protein